MPCHHNLEQILTEYLLSRSVVLAGRAFPTIRVVVDVDLEKFLIESITTSSWKGSPD
jgi:hypothetical protein